MAYNCWLYNSPGVGQMGSPELIPTADIAYEIGCKVIKDMDEQLAPLEQDLEQMRKRRRLFKLQQTQQNRAKPKESEKKPDVVEENAVKPMAVEKPIDVDATITEPALITECVHSPILEIEPEAPVFKIPEVPETISSVALPPSSMASPPSSLASPPTISAPPSSLASPPTICAPQVSRTPSKVVLRFSAQKPSPHSTETSSLVFKLPRASVPSTTKVKIPVRASKPHMDYVEPEPMEPVNPFLVTHSLQEKRHSPFMDTRGGPPKPKVVVIKMPRQPPKPQPVEPVEPFDPLENLYKSKLANTEQPRMADV